jgi:hypothetical protein
MAALESSHEPEPEPDVPASGPVPLPYAAVADYEAAERAMVRRMRRDTLLATPITMLFFATVLGVAASVAGASVVGAAGAGAVIGLLGGLFVGVWAGVVGSVASFEELEGHPHRKPAKRP